MADKSDKPITMTADDLRAFGEAVGRGVALANGPDQAHAETPHENYFRRLREAGRTIGPEHTDTTPHVHTELRRVSVRSRASFTAVVAKSRTFPDGRVVDLKDYTHPPEALKHEGDGGHVPRGMPIHEQTPGGLQMSMRYKQWRHDYYWLTDATEYVGKSGAHLQRFTDAPAQTA